MNHLIKISLRRISRERGYAIVNILGLALGMASALIIFLFLRFETSYDSHHPNHELIYRIGTDLTIFNQSHGYAVSSAAIAPALAKEFDEIESYLRLFHLSYFLQDVIYYSAEKAFYDSEILAVDSTFFDFFQHEFLSGDPESALENPYSIVFTRSLALKVFGHIDIIGNIIQISNAGALTVSAVIEDTPINSQIQFNGLISMSSLRKMPGLFEYSFGPGVRWDFFEETYGSTVVWSYIRVKENFSAETFVETQWKEFYQRNVKGLIADRNFDLLPIFLPMANIHLNSNLLYEHSRLEHIRLMNRQMVRVFFIVAIFLLVIAAINYTNMAISHFNKRRKEMAMVKILGSKAYQLFAGFFTESFIIAFISLLLALVMAELVIVPLNEFLNVSLSLNWRHDWGVGLIVLGVFLFTAILSGLFPSVYFVYTPPVKLLMSRFYAGKKTLLLKKALVIIQFSVAVMMISAAFVVSGQFRYIQGINLGYNVENISVLEIQSREDKQRIQLLDSLLRNSEGVKTTAKSNYIFSMYPIKHTMLFELDDEYTVRSYNSIQTTEDYLRLMGVKINTGDESVNDIQTLHSNGVLVNMVLADSINYDSPVGKNIVTHYQFLEGRHRQNRVIKGVVDNFHYALLNKPVEPLVILPLPDDRVRYLVVKFSEIDYSQRETILLDAWSSFGTNSPLQFFHLEDNVDGFFSYNRNLSQFFGYFAWLFVIISFLGVFGITAYNIDQRTIEIGIRKVMGANGFDYFVMFMENYLALYFIGSTVGLVVSYVILNQWLTTFAFSLNPGIWPFLFAAVCVGLTIFIAIFIHIIRIQYMNPADALRKT